MLSFLDMELIHDKSPHSTKEELDLFTVEPTQTSILETNQLELSSVTSDLTAGPIEFYYAGSSDKYIDLAATKLYIKCKITKSEGGDLDVGAKSTTINNLLHSLFTQVDLYLNDRLVDPSIPTYPWKAYLENLLNFDDPAQKSQLTASGWYRDTAGKFDSADPAGENNGAKDRYNLISGGKSVQLIGRPHCNFFFQHKLMLPGVNIKLRLTRAPNQFTLMSDVADQPLKITIEETHLYLRSVTVAPSILLGHARALEKTPAKYNLRRSQVTSYTIPSGSLTSSKDNLFIGNLPRRLVISLVDNKAFAGSLDKNPFNFKHYNASYMSVSVNGRSFPNQPFIFNFDKDQYIRGFNTLFENTGRLGRNEGSISRTDYSQGFFLTCLNLASDQSDGSHFNARNTGTIKLDLHFSKALAENVTVIVYAEFDTVIEINKNRTVMSDYM